MKVNFKILLGTALALGMGIPLWAQLPTQPQEKQQRQDLQQIIDDVEADSGQIPSLVPEKKVEVLMGIKPEPKAEEQED